MTRLLCALPPLLLAGLLAVALDQAELTLWQNLVLEVHSQGFLVLVGLPALLSAIKAAPAVLLAVFWLRDLGGAPTGFGAGPVTRAALSAWVLLLSLVVANTLLLIPATLLFGVLFSGGRAVTDGALPGPNDLTIPALLLMLCTLAVAVWLLPSILRRAASLPPGSLTYRGPGRWIAAALLCLAAAFLSSELYGWLLTLQGSPAWLLRFLPPLPDLLVTALLALVLFRLLRPPVAADLPGPLPAA